MTLSIHVSISLFFHHLYHAEPDFFMIGSPIHLIVRLLINWIDVYMYVYVYIYTFKWNIVLKSPLFQMTLMKEKIIGPTSLNIYKHDNSYVKMLKPWFFWWPFGSDVYSSQKGLQTWQNASVQKCV